MSFRDVVLDLETMGTRPGSAIGSIGAVQVDLANGLLGEEFYQVIDLETAQAAGLVLDAATVKWWLRQDARVRQEMVTDYGREMDAVLEEFASWLGLLGPGVRVWGCGPSFDCALLAEAYRKMLWPVQLPWDYRNERCLRTVRAMYPQVVSAGHEKRLPHHALHDAVHEAKVLVAILDHMDRDTRRALAGLEREGAPPRSECQGDEALR